MGAKETGVIKRWGESRGVGARVREEGGGEGKGEGEERAEYSTSWGGGGGWWARGGGGVGKYARGVRVGKVG